MASNTTLDFPAASDSHGSGTVFAGYHSLYWVIPAVITTCGLVVWCMLFWVLYKERIFHKPGYYMLINASVCQLSCAIWGSLIVPILVITHRFHPLPSLIGSNVITRLIVFMVDSSYMAAMSTLDIICVQRVIAVYYYSSYKRLVTWRSTAVCIAFTWLLGVGFGLPCQIGPCKVYYDIVFTAWNANWGNPYTKFYSDMYLWSVMISVIFMIVIYAMISYRLRKQHMLVGTAGGATGGVEGENKRDEVRICLQFMLISLIYAVPSTYFYLLTHVIDLSLLPIAQLEAHKILLELTWVVTYTIDPYIHLAINKRLRQGLGKRFNLQFLGGTSTIGGSSQ